mgnify:CR=1 FL=1
MFYVNILYWGERIVVVFWGVILFWGIYYECDRRLVATSCCSYHISINPFGKFGVSYFHWHRPFVIKIALFVVVGFVVGCCFCWFVVVF